MRRRVLPALLLALLLCGCAARTPADTQTSPPPEESAPATEYDFAVLPVRKDSIRTLYSQEGYEVRKITPYEGDYLVEYGDETRTISLTPEAVEFLCLEHASISTVRSLFIHPATQKPYLP